MDIPTITDFDNYPFRFVNEYVENIALSNGAKYLDLLPILSEYDPKELEVSFMDAHMNELGHSITAEVLFNFLEQSRLLEK